MKFGSYTNSAIQTVNAYSNRDQVMSTMGYKGIETALAANNCLQEQKVKNEFNVLVCPKREVFDPKTVVMPKMEVRNAPKYPVWSTMGGH